ncbi:hypothetical protein IU405_08105 [Polaribacter sp. BAL334]|uniref:hypothetical protein n=1 Tax=Polaribacter sp. BAL334 TaxID=1708178 RepID=UPI0018D228C0|nr:hypothetical protein [Polaribacter sp. BAL334]MBG7612207.1 hypothetical protein [Polaribacter sp. BAL334]
MKNVLTTLLIIISIHTYSQNELKNNFLDIFNAVKVEENHFQSQDISQKFNFQIFEEIKNSEDLKNYPIAEKKFILKLNSSSIFSEKIQEKLSNKNNVNKSMLVEINNQFLENLIVKIYIENDQIEEIILDSSENYGDRNIDLYRNFSDLEDKLLVNYIIDKNKSIQFGNNMMPYLNKILKTDVEKTLNTSLNLLAVNF